MNDQELQQSLADRLKQLPRVVQDAILSADVQAHMRELASYHKLHFDQWQVLENNVMLTLLGFQEPEDLADNFEKDLGVDQATADALAIDVSEHIFEPIRAELEKDLQYAVETDIPEEEAVASHAAPPVAQIRAQGVLTPATIIPVAVLPVQPGTPPSPPPEGKAVRAPISESYSAGQASHERKIIEGDPYRESAA